jgi:ribonuclease P protein component
MGVIYQPAFSVKPLDFRTSKMGRLRIVVSAKVSKKATERNLMRRRIKEIWRLLSPKTAVCIYVRKPALLMSFAQIKNELTRILR